MRRRGRGIAILPFVPRLIKMQIVNTHGFLCRGTARKIDLI